MSLSEEKVLPFLRIATVGGTSFALNELGGRPAVIFLWASWHPCRSELAKLRAHATVGGPQIVTIALDATGPALPMKYLRGPSAPWHLLIDACALVSRVWGIRRVPATLVVDAEGRLQRAGDRPEPVLLDLASKLPNADTPRPWPRVESLEACPPQVEVLVQGCGIFLSRKRIDDAADSLRAALSLDPSNDIIRTQILALKHPEKFYDGEIDARWVEHNLKA
jgi:hypothetical protein